MRLNKLNRIAFFISYIIFNGNFNLFHRILYVSFFGIDLRLLLNLANYIVRWLSTHRLLQSIY